MMAVTQFALATARIRWKNRNHMNSIVIKTPTHQQREILNTSKQSSELSNKDMLETNGVQNSLESEE